MFDYIPKTPNNGDTMADEDEKAPSGDENPGNEHPGMKNLKPWPKGTSGNPAGRPIGARNRKDVMREILDTVFMTAKGEVVIHPVTGLPMTYLDKILYSQALNAAVGDTPAFNAVMDSGFGKITDMIGNDPENPFGAPEVITVKFVKPKKTDEPS